MEPASECPPAEDAVQRRTRLGLRWTTICLCVASLWIISPVWPALVLASWAAGLGRPLLVRFARALRGRHRAAAVLCVLLIITLLLPVGLVAAGVVSGVHDLADTLASSPSAASALKSLTRGAGAAGLDPPQTLDEVVALVERFGSKGVGVLTGIVGAALRSLFSLFVFFGGTYVLFVEGADVWAWLRRHAPIRPEHADRLASAFHETGRGLIVGVGLTTATQGLVATLTYLALGVPRAWVLGPLTGLAAVIPVLGSALIWAPIALGLYLDGSQGKALLLGVLGAGLISTIDNILRPIYARVGALRMPLYLLFLAVFGGILLIGPWGALLGPLVVRLTMEALLLDAETRSLAATSQTPSGLP